MSKQKSETLNDVRAASQSAVQAPSRSMQITCTLKSEMIERMRRNSKKKKRAAHANVVHKSYCACTRSVQKKMLYERRAEVSTACHCFHAILFKSREMMTNEFSEGWSFEDKL